MTDRELLELAAKAAGLDVQRSRLGDPLFRDFLMNGHGARNLGSTAYPWNPLTDDGDALRLAVKLNLVVLSDQSGISTASGMHQRAKELHGDDPLAATRRSIVRAAAEIGRNMK